MKASVDLFNKRAVNVGVNLCGNNGAVTKHFLHGAQVGTPFKQMGCECVAKGVRADVFLMPASMAYSFTILNTAIRLMFFPLALRKR